MCFICILILVKSIIHFLIFVIIFNFFAIIPVFSEDSDETPVQEEQKPLKTKHSLSLYNFSVSPFFGFAYGQAEELVYPTSTRAQFLSELIWEMKPVYYIGGKFEFGLIDKMTRLGFFSSLSMKAGVPGFTGIHENSDWESIENNALTHFSSHDNRTIEFFWADIDIGATIPAVFLYIKPFFTGSWMRFSFSGHDGEGKYAREKNPPSKVFYPISDNPKLREFSGKVITYQQNWFLASAGLAIGTEILSPFYLEMSFKISTLTYCAAVDHHIEAEKVFYDYTGLGLFLEPKASISYRLNNLIFSAEGIYRHIGHTRGITYLRQNNNEFVIPLANESGAGLSLFSVNILLRILL